MTTCSVLFQIIASHSFAIDPDSRAGFESEAVSVVTGRFSAISVYILYLNDIKIEHIQRYLSSKRAFEGRKWSMPTLYCQIVKQ